MSTGQCTGLEYMASGVDILAGRREQTVKRDTCPLLAGLLDIV